MTKTLIALAALVVGTALAGTARLNARVTKGVRYTFWCGVGGHAAVGMRGTFVAR